MEGGSPESGSATEQVLVKKRASVRVQAYKIDVAPVPKVSPEELRIKIRELRRKQKDTALSEREELLLKEYIYDLSQVEISEDSGYAEVTEATRAKALTRILEETDPDAVVASKNPLSFEHELSSEETLRILSAAEQIIDMKHERKAKEIQEILTRKIAKEIRKPTVLVAAWIEEAKKRIRS